MGLVESGQGRYWCCAIPLTSRSPSAWMLRKRSNYLRVRRRRISCIVRGKKITHRQVCDVAAGQRHTFSLKPFEVLVLEGAPLQQ